MSFLGLSPALARALIWFVGLSLLHITLQLVWRQSTATCSTATVSRLLISLLFAERGLLELYSHFYRPRRSSEVGGGGGEPLPLQEVPSLFSGRSALWVRLVLSFALLVTSFLAVVEGAGAVFQFEVTPTSKKSHHLSSTLATSDTTDHSSDADPAAAAAALPVPDRENHAGFQRGKSPLESSSTDHHLNKNTAGFDRTDNYRRTTALHAAAIARRRPSPADHLSTGAGDPYSLLLHGLAPCVLSKSLLAVIAVWFFHAIAALLAQAVTAKTYFRPLQRRRNGQHQQEDDDDDKKRDASSSSLAALEAAAPTWALQVDLLTELKLSGSIAVLSFCLHGASHMWSLDAASEIPAYLSFLTGCCILYIEGNAVLAVARCLTLALSPNEEFLVEQLEQSMGKHLTSCTVSSLRAFKTEKGQLGLVVECSDLVEEGTKEEIVALLRTNTTWDRVIDQTLLLLRIS